MAVCIRTRRSRRQTLRGRMEPMIKQAMSGNGSMIGIRPLTIALARHLIRRGRFLARTGCCGAARGATIRRPSAAPLATTPTSAPRRIATSSSGSGARGLLDPFFFEALPFLGGERR